MTDLLDDLCADALSRLPSCDELAEVAALLLRAYADGPQREEYRDGSVGRMGDALAGRAVKLAAGGLELILSADWLDRRGPNGEEVRDGPWTPAGLVDARVRLVDVRTRAEVRSLLARGATSEEALAALLRIAPEYGWPTAQPRSRRAVLAAVA